MQEIKKAMVVGAGLMGHGIAQCLAASGMDIILVDQKQVYLDKARQWIEMNLETAESLGQCDKAASAATLSRITFSTNLESAARKVEFVFEVVSEDLALKRQIFGCLDAYVSENVILASNTSSYDIGDLADAAPRHRDKVIGVHWFHPPTITPCVEVVVSSYTSSSVFEQTMALMKRVGKFPTRCQSAPGFVANRIQFALAAEAFAIVEEGLATPEEVDRIVKSSFGFRLGAYGPFEISDQAGADTYLAIFEYLHEKLGRDHFQPPEILSRQVSAGKLGIKSGEGFYSYADGAVDRIKRERDERLYARLNLFNREQNP